MRRTVGLNVAQGGSFDIASEAYAIVEDGAIFHRPLDDDAVEVHREEVAQETGGAPLVVLGRAEGRKARTGWWAITREECRYDFVVLSMDPADVDSARANNIVEAAQPALLESIARVAPAWWARFGEAADLDPPIVRRVLWLGVAQNVLGVITLVALPPTFVAWRRARSVHRRIHSVVVRRRCPHCGYELEDGIGPRCPECGAELR